MEETPPISSSVYLTMRGRLSGSLVKDVDRNNSDSGSNVDDDFDHTSYPHKRGSRSPNVFDGYDVQSALVNVSLDRMPLPLLDPLPDDCGTDSYADLIEGLRFLSRQRCLTGSKSRLDLLSELEQPQRRSKAIKGRLLDIMDMLSPTGSINGKGYMSKRCVIGPNCTEGFVGPLSVSEVAHLLLLAQKLQETNRIDESLAKDIEMSSNAWRKSGKVPNVVATALVTYLYEGKSFQCPTCGLRFSSSDLKQRHMSSHERVRREVLWSTIDDWVAAPAHVSAVRSSQKSPVTLKTFYKLLDIERPVEPGNVKWLRSMLFPRGIVVSTGVDLPLNSDGVVDHVSEDGEVNMGIYEDSMECLWSWGIMDVCNATPISHVVGASNGATAPTSDPFVLQETCHKVRLNVSICMDKVPFAVNISDLARQTCSLCHDALDVEFSVDYNRLVYCKSSCFKLDANYTSKCFNEEDVSCEMLLSTDALGNLDNPFLVLRKVAALTFLKSCLRYRRNEGFNNWSCKCDFGMIDDNHIIPERNAPVRYDSCLTGDMLLNWKGPFAISEGGEGTPNGLVYCHTDCIRVVLNAHIIRAKQLGAGSSFEGDIAALPVL